MEDAVIGSNRPIEYIESTVRVLFARREADQYRQSLFFDIWRVCQDSLAILKFGSSDMGVTGFDGCSEGLLACRGCLGPRYQTGQTTNGENNYAMAA